MKLYRVIEYVYQFTVAKETETAEPIVQYDPKLEKDKAEYENLKDNIKNWLNELLKPNYYATNFDTDWNDGELLTRFVNAINPNTVPIMYTNLTDSEKCNNALTCVQDKFGITPNFTGNYYTTRSNVHTILSLIQTQG